MLKLIIGPHTNDVRVMCDGVDIGNALRIVSLTIGPLGPNELTQCTMVVHTEAEIELLPEGVTVIVQDPASPAYDKPDPKVCTNCGGVAEVIAGVCSVECMEQIEAGDTPIHETAPKPYTGPVTQP